MIVKKFLPKVEQALQTKWDLLHKIIGEDQSTEVFQAADGIWKLRDFIALKPQSV